MLFSQKNKTGYIPNKIHELIYMFDIGDKEINTTSPSEKKQLANTCQKFFIHEDGWVQHRILIIFI